MARHTQKLPTEHELEQLSLRGVAAYAARSARRGAAVLRGLIEEEIIETPLRIAEQVACVDSLDQSDGVTALRAASRLATAMGTFTTRKAKIAALCLTGTALVAANVLEAAKEPMHSKRTRDLAMRAARRASAVADRAAAAPGRGAAEFGSDFETPVPIPGPVPVP